MRLFSAALLLDISLMALIVDICLSTAPRAFFVEELESLDIVLGRMNANWSCRLGLKGDVICFSVDIKKFYVNSDQSIYVGITETFYRNKFNQN